MSGQALGAFPYFQLTESSHRSVPTSQMQGLRFKRGEATRPRSQSGKSLPPWDSNPALSNSSDRAT